MNRRDFLKSAAALAGAAALPVKASENAVLVTGESLGVGVNWHVFMARDDAAFDVGGDYICSSIRGWSFRGHSEKPRVIDYVEPNRLIYRGRRGVNVPAWYEPEREYLGVL